MRDPHVMFAGTLAPNNYSVRVICVLCSHVLSFFVFMCSRAIVT